MRPALPLPSRELKRKVASIVVTTRDTSMVVWMLTTAVPFGGTGAVQPVTGLDTCVRKQLIATCSTDMSVRIWNIKEMGCDLAKYFNDEAYSISLHPSGLHVLVGFADKVRRLHGPLCIVSPANARLTAKARRRARAG
jgi:WD40 repeat protein